VLSKVVALCFSGLLDRILLNCTRIENAHKIRKKTFVFCDVQKSTHP